MEGIFLLEEDLEGGLIPHQRMTHFLLQMLILEEVGTRVQPSSLCAGVTGVVGVVD